MNQAETHPAGLNRLKLGRNMFHNTNVEIINPVVTLVPKRDQLFIRARPAEIQTSDNFLLVVQ